MTLEQIARNLWEINLEIRWVTSEEICSFVYICAWRRKPKYSDKMNRWVNGLLVTTTKTFDYSTNDYSKAIVDCRGFGK